ncbi:hypothetical protein ACJ72_04288 [Emergomyces africanus]|uniref:PPM-type phosphatase domain-containing protein n=1 Tax=Emergomyces africanus TaxID=1955775 RepID=A0A1B7NX86_9EURO|nr:hypothetical protein ACJ72_04288 [Emergomyces africanus]
MDSPNGHSFLGSRRGLKLRPIQTNITSPNDRPKRPPRPDYEPARETVADRAPLKSQSSKSSLKSLFSRNKASRRSNHEQTLPAIAESQKTTSPNIRVDTISSPNSPSTTPMTPKSFVATSSPLTGKTGSNSASNPSTSLKEKGQKLHRTITVWDPPPLFQAYPQAIKQGTLPAPPLSGGPRLRMKGHRRNMSAKEDFSDVDADDERVSSTGAKKRKEEKHKANHSRKVSSSINKAEWAQKIFILVTSGYLLQYAGEGSFDRLPEKMMELGKNSVAFASDAIPGRHWVLQISHTLEEDGTVALDTKKTFFSRFGFSESRKQTKTLLLVCNDPAEMTSWLSAVRREIEALGGKEYVPETPLDDAFPNSQEPQARFIRQSVVPDKAQSIPMKVADRESAEPSPNISTPNTKEEQKPVGNRPADESSLKSANRRSIRPQSVEAPSLSTNAQFPAVSSFLSTASTPDLLCFARTVKLAGSKRRSFASNQGGLLNRMFGGSTSPTKEKDDSSTPPRPGSTVLSINTEDTAAGLENRATSPSSSLSPRNNEDRSPSVEQQKRRSSSMTKAATFFSHAKNSLHLSSARESHREQQAQTPIQKLGKMDPALIVPQGSLNNSAGESAPTARSSFRVGVTEDKNRKCRRTMEDTHAYLYNFLGTSAPTPPNAESPSRSKQSEESTSTSADSDDSTRMVETDNGYFAIFDGHAGTFAAEWCGKKLHLILEDMMRKHPNTPVPELLDQAFTNVDQQLEKLPLKNSGCTAVTAILRWEDRVAATSPPPNSTTSSQPAASKSAPAPAPEKDNNADQPSAQTSLEPSGLSASAPGGAASQKTQETTTMSRQRVLYTANVGDARVVLCRNGKALRLSYDHKGSDENEGKRISNAGGLILNNRVNGVLAVTRALGDSYMKDLVTGHPYTTETVIQPETDEFLILACDGLWDVCSDQEAVDLIRGTEDPQLASKILVDHALSRFSTDNLSCMIVRFDTKAIQHAIDQQLQQRRTSPTTDTAAALIRKATRRHQRSGQDRRRGPKKALAGKLGAEVAAAEEGEEEKEKDDDDENATPAETFSAIEDDELGPEVSAAELKGVIEVANLDLAGGRSRNKVAVGTATATTTTAGAGAKRGKGGEGDKQ